MLFLKAAAQAGAVERELPLEDIADAFIGVWRGGFPSKFPTSA